ncbi:helix-turn-helix transcriptional regulator [Roseivirga sp. BDSF3-8]|uniref:helix-turn-helix transcriptional regulator n=1 Tax=Roseivirga sp. BDSF3-8 TaxID=3241598 RepID=UPI0035320231
MDTNDTKRISRLTAILTQLQTKRLVTSTELASKFQVSIRTIYRDIRALENAGIPILTEEGKGYYLMDHYRLAPVMFTEKEANALIVAEQLILKNKDASLIQDYSDAIDKVKAVLRYETKDKANLLLARTRYAENISRERTSNNLSSLQYALTNFLAVNIQYTNNQKEETERIIEPFAILSTENWLLVGWCRLRRSFRYFRLDRISNLMVLDEKFEPHNMTLQEFFEKFH